MVSKRLAAVMAVVMTVSGGMVACGNSEKPKSNSGSDSAALQTESEIGNSQEVQENSWNKDYRVTWDDMAQIVVLYPSMSSIPSGLGAVEDAINEITEKEINVHVKLIMTESGTHDQQMNLMLSANEQLDLALTIPAGGSSFSSMAAQNQLMDITELMTEYAPKTLETVGDYIKGTQIDGKTYGLTCLNSFASGIYIHMRTDVLESLGLLEKAENMTSFAEYEEILEAVKNSEEWNYLSGISGNRGQLLAFNTSVYYADTFADCYHQDNLGNTQAVVSVLPDSDEVVNTFSTECFVKNYERARSWYEKGYVYKDAATTAEDGTALVKANVIFSYITQVEFGAESAIDNNCGMDMTSVLVTEMPVSTGSLTKFTWVMPAVAREPEAAMTFLEMLFNDSRIANLMTRGIEGVDYYVTEDGVGAYIDGNDNPAYRSDAFLMPNKFVVIPWAGEDPNQNAIGMENMKNALKSPYLGFAVDTTSVANEISAITNVLGEYMAQVTSGMADQQTYDEFLEKLETSGIDNVIALYQEKLDVWK